MSCLKLFDITIIGAGHAGVAQAAMASKAGLKVGLYADPQHRGSNFNVLLKQYITKKPVFGEAIISSSGEVVGDFPVTLVFSLQEAVFKSAELANNLPEYAHDEFITALSLCEGLENVYISTVTANGFSLKARNRVHPKGFIDCVVAPGASRATQGASHVAGIKSGMFLALFPKDLPDSALNNWRKVFPAQEIRKLPNSLAALFANANLWLHSMPLLLTTVALEKKTPGLKFYPDCVGSKLGCRHATNLARSIYELAAVYDIDLLEGVDLMQFFYNFYVEGSDRPELLGKFVKGLPAYKALTFLPDIETIEGNRYFTEDPPLLNLLAALADLAGSEGSIFRSVVHTIGMAIHDDYKPVKEDLSRLDMEGFSKAQILETINMKQNEWDALWREKLEAKRKATADLARREHFDKHMRQFRNNPQKKQVWEEFQKRQF